MTTVSSAGDTIVVENQGWDKLWSLKSRFEIPFVHIERVEVDSDIARGKKGFRAPGTHIPGKYTSGTYYCDGDRNFWNVRNPDNVVVIHLRNERYARLIIEVEDPLATVELIEPYLRGSSNLGSESRASI